ncbi:uncharacterized protein LOC132546015 [Ylistrum balloti]|uniref:uncharacterized protein LOC132546015 n=1 Tax=Ylistrum balloti TaxID=509963 RepID=UPI00290594CD|nr:uncharacterized protein LOC132546015 [Ylistrum balloti]
MDPPVDYSRYTGHYRDTSADGRFPPSRTRDHRSPQIGIGTTSPSWDQQHSFSRGRSPDPFRETAFNGNMGRYAQEDRGTFFPPGGIQQPVRPLPRKDGDHMGFTRVPNGNPRYQKSFRDRYLGDKTRYASMSSRGSDERPKFAYDNMGFQPKYREPERRSDGSLASVQRGYMFDTDFGHNQVTDKYDENNYIYRDRRMANGSTRKMNRSKYSDVDEGEKKVRRGVGFAMLLRLVTCLLIFWDLANDWVVGASGPSPFVRQDESTSKACSQNEDVFEYLNISNTKARESICLDTVNIWTSLTVFMLLGSLIAIIQCINITMETITIVRGKKVFRILSGQSELCLTIFCEEIPQAIIMIVLLFHCKCPPNKVDINLFALLASISACVSAIFRLCVSYDYVTGNDGCCNQWWRCCCCRNIDYCCEVKPREFFCTCEIPFPMFCCTLNCDHCKCSPVTWCNFILKTFGCFCDCCQEKETSYGIRLVNLFGISLLLLSFGLQVFVFVVTVH